MNMMKKNYSVSLKMKNSYYPVSAYKEPTIKWVFSIIHLHNLKIYLMINPRKAALYSFNHCSACSGASKTCAVPV